MYGAGGHPNGECKMCGKPAVSLAADYCSQKCRYQHQKNEQYAEHTRNN